MRDLPKTPAYNLVPAHMLPKLPATGDTAEKSDPMVHIKLFDPTGSWTWFIIEYDPEDRVAYGWVCGFEKEFGSFSLAELEQHRGHFGLGIERDLHFKPCRISKLPKRFRPDYL